MVCQALGVTPGRHHDAGDDAGAAAGIALGARQQMSNLPDLAASLMVRLGALTGASWVGCIASMVPTQRPAVDLDADPHHPLYGKLVAFTGGLSVTRAEASALIAALGATPSVGPSKHTDFLVMGRRAQRP